MSTHRIPAGLVWGRWYLGGKRHLGYTLGRLESGPIPTCRDPGVTQHKRELRPQPLGGDWARPADTETFDTAPAALVPA